MLTIRSRNKHEDDKAYEVVNSKGRAVGLLQPLLNGHWLLTFGDEDGQRFVTVDRALGHLQQLNRAYA